MFLGPICFDFFFTRIFSMCNINTENLAVLLKRLLLDGLTNDLTVAYFSFCGRFSSPDPSICYSFIHFSERPAGCQNCLSIPGHKSVVYTVACIMCKKKSYSYDVFAAGIQFILTGGNIVLA